MSIRTFDCDRDLAAVLALWQGAGPGIHLGRSDGPEEIRKKAERDPDLFLVAEHNGRMIGAVVGGFDGRRGLVYHLAVAASHRRQGVGRQLMEEVERRLRSKGCLKMYLMVARDNPGALDFYQRLGWEPMDLHLLGKELA
jgi:ribosomal protein S18 acetylase RimI-like enzyme